MSQKNKIYEEMKAQGKGNEISLCLDCGREFWIWWKAHGKSQGVHKPMTKCPVDYFKTHK